MEQGLAEVKAVVCLHRRYLALSRTGKDGPPQVCGDPDFGYMGGGGRRKLGLPLGPPGGPLLGPRD